MNISITNLPDEVLAVYSAVASERGVALEALLRELLVSHAPAPSQSRSSPEDWEQALDDCFDSFPPTSPLPDSALSRQSIYEREDKW